jgi:hypothetical protein
MTTDSTQQTMKPATAARKLGVHLPATPEDFRNSPVSRSELNALIAAPPEWLLELRRNGPHPRPVLAARLGVSIAGLVRGGLTRGGLTEALTTAQIQSLLAQPPTWLVQERATQAAVRAENRQKKLRAAEAHASTGSAGS